MENNKPIITLRDRNLSVSIFKKEGKNEQGKTETYYSACLQRSYKPKDEDEYKRESINLYPDELLKIASIANNAYTSVLKYANEHKPANNHPAQSFTPTEYQAAKDGDLTPPSWASEEIPM